MFKYDGFDFEPYLLVTDIGRPILPPQKLTTKSIFGKHGAYFLRKQHDPIEIPVDVLVYANNGMTYREMTRFLAQHLNKNEEKQLIFKDEPDRYIEGIIQDSTELENAVESGEGTLTFYCSNPFYYALEDEVFTYSSAGSYNFTRTKGNTESYPTIEIDGTNSTGTITLTTDNTEINFNGLLSSGETLVFDSFNITSYILQTDGSRRSGNNDIDTMEFPVFPAGANNVTVSVSGDATVSEIRIYCNSRWV